MCIKRQCSLGLELICCEKISLQIYKKYNKSRLNSQSDHLITLLTIPHMTIDEIFLDDGNVLWPRTDYNIPERLANYKSNLRYLPTTNTHSSRTQSSWTHSSRTQSSRTQSSRTQSSWTHSSRTQSSRTQSSRTQSSWTHTAHGHRARGHTQLTDTELTDT